MWVALNEQVAVTAIPKNACMALQDRFGRPRKTDEEVAHIPRRVFFIRDPMARFYSAYCYFCMVRDADGEYKPIGRGHPVSYEAFVDRTFEIEDRHWNPQVDQCRAYTELRPWHELPAFVEEITGTPLAKLNSSPSYPHDPGYRLYELANRYSRDYDMINTLPVDRRPAPF